MTPEAGTLAWVGTPKVLRASSVLLLVAAKGSTITITCDGEDAQPCLDSLTQLVQTGFGEE